MACSCRGRARKEFVWTSDDGLTTVVYTKKIAAEAKKTRKGGDWVERDKK